MDQRETCDRETGDGGEAGAGVAGDDISVRADIANLAGDFREFVAAELRYYQSRLQYGASVARWAGLYLFIALAALFGACIALILGLLLILAQWLGTVWAVVILCGGFATIGGIFLLMARNTARKMRFPEIGPRDD